ncbi:MAG: NAD(P)-binding protein [bacterium]
MQQDREIRRVDTLIVGGGISGLACGRALAQAGHDFLLVTDRAGGRMYTSDTGLPFGAAYITSDYRHVLPLADHGKRISKKDVYTWDGSRFITMLSPRNVWRLGKLATLYRLLTSFRRRLNELRRRAPFECQAALMEADPLLRRYVEQPATDFVREHHLEEVTEVYSAPLFHSTLFVPWQEANAFYYLANLFPILVSTYPLDLRRAAERLTDGWNDRVLLQKITAVEELDGEGFIAHAGERRWQAKNLVLAIPDRNARSLLEVPSFARDVPYATLHVRGRRRRQFVTGGIVFLRSEHPARVLWPQANGDDIVFSATTDPDLSAYYEGYELTGAVYWKTAVQLSSDRWRPLEPRPHLFTIGDHNIVGLEDCYLTGLYAANRILGRRGPD